MSTDPKLPAALQKRLGRVRSLGAITGAGISTESGIRPYRGKGGLYDDPEEGERTVEALSGPTLLLDPDRTWRVVAQLARQAGTAMPNPGHDALVAMETRLERFVLLTQNVDGLHRLAGSRNVIDIHGNVFDTLCTSCNARGELDRELLVRLDRAPRCGRCGGTLRPDVVLFGEMLPMAKLARLREEFYGDALDAVVVAGTTAMFPYISEPVVVARAQGRVTIEVNPEPTVLTDEVDWSLRGSASEWLPLITQALPRRPG